MKIYLNLLYIYVCVYVINLLSSIETDNCCPLPLESEGEREGERERERRVVRLTCTCRHDTAPACILDGTDGARIYFIKLLTQIISNINYNFCETFHPLPQYRTML